MHVETRERLRLDHLIQWGRVSQSTPETTDLASFFNQLTRRPLCLHFLGARILGRQSQVLGSKH